MLIIRHSRSSVVLHFIFPRRKQDRDGLILLCFHYRLCCTFLALDLGVIPMVTCFFASGARRWIWPVQAGLGRKYTPAVLHL